MGLNLQGKVIFLGEAYLVCVLKKIIAKILETFESCFGKILFLFCIQMPASSMVDPPK